MTFFDASAECDATELSSFDYVVVIVAAQITQMLQSALAIEGAIVMRAAIIRSEHLTDSNIGALQEALRGREPLIFTSPINARAELRGWLRRPRGPVLSFLENSATTTVRDRARELYQSGQIGEAFSAYEAVINKGDVTESDREAALLGSILCLIAMGRDEDARSRATSLQVSALSPAARLTATRAFAALSLDCNVDVSDEQADELRAFNELRVGSVPATPPKTPDLVLQAARLLVQEKRFETAATWILIVALEGTSHAPLGVLFAEVAATLIEEWSWNMPSDAPLQHETAAQLLSAIEAVDAALSERPLDNALLVRLIRAKFQVAIRTVDVTKSNRLARKLEELGSPLPKDEDFTTAVEAAKRGDLDAATKLLGAIEPEWRGRFQRATMLFLAEQPAAGLATLLELTVEMPGVPIVEAEAARRLIAQRRYDQALRHAESAFLMLPGIGQRLMFAECLLALDQNERVVELLRVFVDRDDRARVLFAQAIEKTNLPEALAQWNRHLEANPDDWQSQVHLVALYAQSGVLKTAADRAWDLVQKRATDLASTVLFQAALLQNAAPIGDEERIRRIAHIHALLETRGRREDDTLRVLLWQYLRNREALPASDLRTLVQTVAAPGSEDDRAQTELQRASRERLKLLYEWGHISLNAAWHALADDPAQLILRLGDDIALPPGEPTRTSNCDATLGDYKGLHLGLFELLALGRLALLRPLADRLGPTLRLRVFEDVSSELLHIILELSQEQPAEQVLQATRLVAAAESGYAMIVDSKSDACWVDLTSKDDEIDLASFFAWLRDSGALSVNTYTRASAGLAGPQPNLKLASPIGLRVSALRWLVERDLLTLISRALGGQLRVLQSDLSEIRGSIARAERRSAALALATETHSWLGARQLAGTAVIIARRPVTLPNIRPNAIQAQLSSVIFSLSSKEELVDAPDSCLVALEPFVRDLFSSSVFVPNSLYAFQWTEPLHHAARARYAPTAKQVYGIVWLASQLAPERGDELTEELLIWGDSSAFSAQSLLQLARDYPTFAGRASRVLALQEAALSEPRHAQHPAAHFALAKVEGEFLRLSLGTALSAKVHDWWRALLARWHKVSAPQKVWLLGFAMSGLVDSAGSAFVPVPGTDLSRMSPDSTIDAAAGALAEWADGEIDDIIGHTVTDLLLTIDGERNGTPSTIELAPIVMLLSKARPPTDLLSLSHSWMEPLVILSCTWPSSPLEQMSEQIGLPDGLRLQITLSELLTRAVTLTEEHPKDVLFGLTGVRFKWPVSETHHFEAEVPLEAVLLSTKPEVTRVLALSVASTVGRFDGVLYELLTQLSADPADEQCRRAFARRATGSPMRLVRRIPGMLAYWGMSYALPAAINVTEIEELRELLSEPPLASTDNAAKRLFSYADSIWKERSDLAAIAGQSARFPGVMGWQWADRAIELEDDEELTRAQLLLTHPASAHFGELWWCVATEWLRAAGTEDLGARQEFASAIDNLLEHLVQARERGMLEARTLSCVRGVIARLGATGNEALWLTYRLFGWWFAIAIQHEAGIDKNLSDLASGRQPTSSITDDAADPLQWGDDFDVRLSSVLNALAVCPDLVTNWAKTRDKPAWRPFLSPKSIDTLIELASANIGDEPDTSQAMDWFPPIRISTGALVALFRNGGKFSKLPEHARQAWLSWIPTTMEEDQRRPRTVVLQLIHFAVMELGNLSPLEGALLADRCLNSEAPNVKQSPITAVAIASAAGRNLISLDEALARVMPHLEDTDIGRAIVAVYLDSTLDVEPARVRHDALTVLRRIGRDVSDASLVDLVRSEPSFSNQEAVRARLLAALADVKAEQTS